MTAVLPESHLYSMFTCKKMRTMNRTNVLPCIPVEHFLDLEKLAPCLALAK